MLKSDVVNRKTRPVHRKTREIPTGGSFTSQYTISLLGSDKAYRYSTNSLSPKIMGWLIFVHGLFLDVIWSTDQSFVQRRKTIGKPSPSTGISMNIKLLTKFQVNTPVRMLAIVQNVAATGVKGNNVDVSEVA